MKYSYSACEAPCPICANIDNKLLYKITAAEAAKHFLVTHNIEQDKLPLIETQIAGLWNATTAKVISCNNCSFVFASPFVSGNYEFYNLLPHSTDDDFENWKWEFEKTYSQIEKLPVKDTGFNLIEIGASTGTFVKRVTQLIPKKNIFCLEYSEIGINSIRNAGIEAHSWSFLELREKQDFNKKFDVICIFQVLEHLDNLHATFETFNAIIKPGGHLFIGVPNAKKIKFNEINDALLDMPPNHIGRYNEKVFKYLANKYNWQIGEMAIEPFSPMDVMATTMYYQGLKSLQSSAPRDLVFVIKEYITIKKMRIQSFFSHKKLGDTLWVHLIKPL